MDAAMERMMHRMDWMETTLNYLHDSWGSRKEEAENYAYMGMVGEEKIKEVEPS